MQGYVEIRLKGKADKSVKRGWSRQTSILGMVVPGFLLKDPRSVHESCVSPGAKSLSSWNANTTIKPVTLYSPHTHKNALSFCPWFLLKTNTRMKKERLCKVFPSRTEYSGSLFWAAFFEKWGSRV